MAETTMAMVREAMRRTAGDGDMRLIEISDERYPELFRQLLAYINQWDGDEQGLVGMADRSATELTIKVLTKVLELQDAARRQRN